MIRRGRRGPWTIGTSLSYPSEAVLNDISRHGKNLYMHEAAWTGLLGL